MLERPAIPSSLRQVVSQTIRGYARQPIVYVLLAFVVQAPAYALLGGLGGATSGQLVAVPVGSSADEAACVALGRVVPVVGTSLLFGTLYVVLAGAITTVVVSEALGQPLVPLQAVRVTGRRLRPLLGGTLLAVAIVGLLLALPLAALGLIHGCYGGETGAELAALVRRAAEETGQSAAARVLAWLSLLAGLLYAIHAAVKWVVMPQVAIVEGGSAPRVLWRSRDLVRGHWLGVAATLLVLLLLQSTVAVLLGLPFTLASALLLVVAPGALAAWLGVAGPALGQIVALPIGALGSSFLYLYLRHTREGYSQADLRQDWDRR